MLPILLLTALLQSPAQTPVPAPHHESNFDTERAQANQLFLNSKQLDALPLYTDLARQDPSIAVFAERHGDCLLFLEATTTDPQERAKVHAQAIAEIKRAHALGDNSDLVRVILDHESKSFVGAVISGVPLTTGYTHRPTPEVQAVFSNAEALFGKGDYDGALKLYIQAASLDPAFYSAPLCAGDTYFHLKDAANAGLWFGKAIAIDPDRETAYRYWGDALLQAGDPAAARDKFVAALIAEPYAQAPAIHLAQWAQHNGHQFGVPAVKRPDFTTPNGQLNIDPTLAASTKDGRSSWIVYQQYRVAHGARTLNQPIVAGGSDVNGVVTPNGYRHTIAEEHAALRAMLADIQTRINTGEITEADLDPSIRNLRALEKGGVLGTWIALNAADAGIRSDYPDYRSHHRQHLVDYINNYLIR